MREGPDGTRDVTLYLWGGALIPQIVSDHLGMTPHAAAAKGDPRGKPERGLRVKLGFWELTARTDGLDVSAHIDELLGYFQNWRTPLTDVPGVDDAAIDIYVIHRDDTYELEFTLAQIAALQRLGLRVMVTAVHSSEYDSGVRGGG